MNKLPTSYGSNTRLVPQNYNSPTQKPQPWKRYSSSQKNCNFPARKSESWNNSSQKQSQLPRIWKSKPQKNIDWKKGTIPKKIDSKRKVSRPFGGVVTFPKRVYSDRFFTAFKDFALCGGISAGNRFSLCGEMNFFIQDHSWSSCWVPKIIFFDKPTNERTAPPPTPPCEWT